MLLVRESDWWNEEGELIDLTKKIYHQNYPDSDPEEDIMTGSTYMAVYHFFIMLDIIKNAAEAVGPENVDSEALYDAAQSYTLAVDGIEDMYSFSETKRFGHNYVAVYEVSAAEEAIVRADAEWIPIVWVRE